VKLKLGTDAMTTYTVPELLITPTSSIISNLGGDIDATIELKGDHDAGVDSSTSMYLEARRS
jgi:hypothetical protein